MKARLLKEPGSGDLAEVSCCRGHAEQVLAPLVSQARKRHAAPVTRIDGAWVPLSR